MIVARGRTSRRRLRAHVLMLAGVETEVRVSDRRGVIGVVDVLLEEARIVIELDGFRAHSSATAFARDRQRQNRSGLAGYFVLRFSWRDLTDRPAAVIAEIRAALAERGFYQAS